MAEAQHGLAARLAAGWAGSAIECEYSTGKLRDAAWRQAHCIDRGGGHAEEKTSSRPRALVEQSLTTKQRLAGLTIRKLFESK